MGVSDVENGRRGARVLGSGGEERPQKASRQEGMKAHRSARGILRLEHATLFGVVGAGDEGGQQRV